MVLRSNKQISHHWKMLGTQLAVLKTSQRWKRPKPSPCLPHTRPVRVHAVPVLVFVTCVAFSEKERG